ncbi:MAG: STAS domain-containing protein [Desulfobacteraceae bacterium]|nr:STAS domain-containing protein [Desulfobacteraceae bacterium]
MKQEIEIHLKRHGDITIFDIHGDVTVFSEPFFNKAYKNANEQDTSKILLKFYESAYINSGGIAVLIQLLAETKKNRQQISITGLSGHFQKIFNMVGISKFAKIYGTMEEAMADMGS